MYHLSDIKKFLRCERLYLYSRDEDNVFKPFLRSDENIIDLIKEYFGIGDCFNGVRNDGNDRFFSSINDHEWFIRPRFMDGEFRINIPLMHKLEDGSFDLYFLYYGTIIKDLDLLNYRSCVKVLDRLGIRVNSIYLIYLNGDYVYEDSLDVSKLFLVSDEYKDEKIISIVRDDDFSYDGLIGRMKRCTFDSSRPVKNRNCRLNGLCDHYGDCFPDEEQYPDDSILTLVSSQNKNRMLEEGYNDN